MKSLLIIFLVIILLMPVFLAERDIDLNDNNEGISTTTTSVNEVKTTEVIVQSSGGGGGGGGGGVTNIYNTYITEPKPEPTKEDKKKEGSENINEEDKTKETGQQAEESKETEKSGAPIITGFSIKTLPKPSPVVGTLIMTVIVVGGLGGYLFARRKNI